MTALRTFTGPLIGACVIFLLAIPVQVVMLCHGGQMSHGASLLYTAALSLIVVWGVELDRRRRGQGAPFQYSEFMFFFWYLLLPHYLFKTRGWRGFWLGIGIVLAILLLPYLIGITVYLFLTPA